MNDRTHTEPGNPHGDDRPGPNSTHPRSTFGDRTIWERFLYMVFCAIAWSIAELLVTLIAVFQFVCVLVNGHVHERALRLGRNLSEYMAELLRFVTFNDERVPFPFSDWPDDPPGDTPWRATPGGVRNDDRGTPPEPERAAPEPPAAPVPSEDGDTGPDDDAPRPPGPPGTS